MSSPPPTPPSVTTAPASAGSMIRAMVGVGFLCGLFIVTVYQWTKPVIERNRAEALQRAIFRVLPGAAASATFRFSGPRGFESVEDGAEGGAGAGELVYAAYDAEGALVGVAVSAASMGYQDVIRVLYGYSLRDDAIVGIQVLESRETPGLGDRIETDADFLANFEALDVSLSEDLSALAHRIEVVKPGEKEHAWQVDAIAGATISSVAVADALARSAASWVPRIRQHGNDLRQRE